MAKIRLERWKEVMSVASGPTILLGITASMGGFLFGADTGQVSGFLIMKVHRDSSSLLNQTGLSATLCPVSRW
jgi:hypothetical protein